MSYAIARVVFGIDLTCGYCEEPHFSQKLPQELQEAHSDDPQNLGLSTGYSASGETPEWVGIVVVQFDECNNFPLSELQKYMTVSPEVLAKWDTVWNDLEPEVRQAITDVHGSEPQVWVIWCSS